MITHDDIWVAIDRLADQLGYSPSGLARKAGLDPTAFNRSKRLSPEGKPRWPSTESIAKILTVTGLSMGQFVVLVEEHPAHAHALPPQDSVPKCRPPLAVPVLPIDLLAHPQALSPDGHPQGQGWGTVSPELLLEDSGDLLAVELPDERYAPVYAAGDVLVASASVPVRRGDRVLAVLADGQGALVGRFVRRTDQKIELSDLLGQNTLTIPPRALRMLARVMLATQ